ncbi:Sphingosine N-acyltransferase lag1 [Smittium culicis]|uniref:Sphingosine N-acyltransferase lag1 n=1 Tax=Smittium culicis TaxID=133412 RepID=A0A1R1YB46_9FUNG|nr:Sphingosine N-acyltransferase lag1 [Smittium culicis]
MTSETDTRSSIDDESTNLIPKQPDNSDSNKLFKNEIVCEDGTIKVPGIVGRFTKRKVTEEDLYKEDEKEVIGATLGFSLALVACYALDPKLFTPFVFLSYPVDNKPGYYNKGKADISMIIQLISVILFLRAFVFRYFLYPLSRLCRITSFKLRVRFCEQGWQLIYGATSFACGVYILKENPEFAGFKEFWSTYPLIEIPISVKLFYIVQISSWFSQVFTLFVEKKRKDFYIMLSHHIVSISLLALAYCSNITFFGIAVHANMDAVDIFLPLSKMFKYMNFNFGVNTSFIAMFITWIYTRHYMLVKLIYSAFVEGPKQTEITWNPATGQYYNTTVRYATFILLSSLEILCILWLSQICQVIADIFKGHGTNDVRSEDEADQPPKDKKKKE